MARLRTGQRTLVNVSPRDNSRIIIDTNKESRKVILLKQNKRKKSEVSL